MFDDVGSLTASIRPVARGMKDMVRWVSHGLLFA